MNPDHPLCFPLLWFLLILDPLSKRAVLSLFVHAVGKQPLASLGLPGHQLPTPEHDPVSAKSKQGCFLCTMTWVAKVWKSANKLTHPRSASGTNLCCYLHDIHCIIEKQESSICVSGFHMAECGETLTCKNKTLTEL